MYLHFSLLHINRFKIKKYISAFCIDLGRLVSGVSTSFQVWAEPVGQKNANKNNAERQRDYQDAVNAIKNQDR